MPDLIDRAQSATAVNEGDALLSHQALCAAREAALPEGRAGRKKNECSICVGNIEPQRLRVLPTTRFCASCAKDFEKMMKKEAKWM